MASPILIGSEVASAPETPEKLIGALVPAPVKVAVPVRGRSRRRLRSLALPPTDERQLVTVPFTGETRPPGAWFAAGRLRFAVVQTTALQFMFVVAGVPRLLPIVTAASAVPAIPSAAAT